MHSNTIPDQVFNLKPPPMLSSSPVDTNLITMVLSTETDHVLYESSEMPLRNQVPVHVHVNLLGCVFKLGYTCTHRGHGMAQVMMVLFSLISRLPAYPM